MATLTGNAKYRFYSMVKKYDKYWDLPKEKCEIETFQADMSFFYYIYYLLCLEDHISCIYNFNKLCSIFSVYCSLSW